MMPGAVAVAWTILSGLFRLYVQLYNYNQAYGWSRDCFDAVALHERRGSLSGRPTKCDCGRLCTREQSLIEAS